MSALPPRRIILCADDYGISPGVNRGIRDLISKGRINATSVMVVGAAIQAEDVSALHDAVKAQPNCSIGLHVTLTAPFRPLTIHFRPLDGGMFLPLGDMLRSSVLRQLDPELVRIEVVAQIAAFTELFGQPPAYLDGHQHVHLFPQVREAFLSAVKQSAPDAWGRQCARALPLRQRLTSPKALLLDVLSAKFKRLCHAEGVKTNTAFAGAYDFTKDADFARLMREFLRGLPDGGLVMCHPGFVDDTLRATDPLTDQRERELNYLSSDAFPALLTDSQVKL